MARGTVTPVTTHSWLKEVDEKLPFVGRVNIKNSAPTNPNDMWIDNGVFKYYDTVKQTWVSQNL